MFWILGYLAAGFVVTALLARYHSEFCDDEGGLVVGVIALWPLALVFWSVASSAVPRLINRIGRRLP